MHDNFTSVILMNLEPVIAEINADLAHARRYRPVVPAVEDTASIGSEGDNVTQDLEFGKGFVDLYFVPLSVAFYRCC